MCIWQLGSVWLKAQESFANIKSLEWYVVSLETEPTQNPPSRDKNQTVFLKVLAIILTYQQLTSSLCPWGENIFLLLRDGTVHNGLGPPILVKKTTKNNHWHHRHATVQFDGDSQPFPLPRCVKLATRISHHTFL